jgi:hypothetical protein
LAGRGGHSPRTIHGTTQESIVKQTQLGYLGLVQLLPAAEKRRDALLGDPLPPRVSQPTRSGGSHRRVQPWAT